MSDGSNGISEAVKGIIGGTIQEAAQMGKTAVGQVINQQPTTPTSSQSEKYVEPGNDIKLAQLRTKLHNEAISVTPHSSIPQAEQPSGPIAEQGFQSSHLQQFGTSQTPGPSIAVKNAINPGETGRNKG